MEMQSWDLVSVVDNHHWLYGPHVSLSTLLIIYRSIYLHIAFNPSFLLLLSVKLLSHHSPLQVRALNNSPEDFNLEQQLPMLSLNVFHCH